MFLKKIELFNFRNYESQEVQFSPEANLITGRNAQGKSNLLEAAYILSHLRSHRVARARFLIREGEKKASVSGCVMEGGRETTIRVKMGEEGKEALVNGRPVATAGKARGILKCVLFSPEDIYLVRGEPSRRRAYLDETMEIVEPGLAGALQEYRHALRQRNTLLRNWESYGAGLTGAMEPWTAALAELGGKIVFERREMVEAVSRLLDESYGRIGGGGNKVELEYAGSFGRGGEDAEGLSREMRAELGRRTEEEKRRRCTVAGPHRDDVVIRLGGSDSRFVASQGEQRTLAFCMRVAQKEYLSWRTGKEPVLMLDDIFSELDESRRRRVLEISGAGGQVLITATEVPEGGGFAQMRILRVEGGEVRVG